MSIPGWGNFSSLLFLKIIKISFLLQIDRLYQVSFKEINIIQTEVHKNRVLICKTKV